MITGVTVRTSALRLVLWKRLAMKGRFIRQRAISGATALVLTCAALTCAALTGAALTGAALPAQAAAYQQHPLGLHLVRATQTTVVLRWSPPAAAMSYTYRLYQLNGVQIRRGCRLAPLYTASCSGLHPGWRYLAVLSARPDRPGADRSATLYLTLPGPNPPRELAYQWAETQAGTRYRYGGQDDGGYDCSGLVRAAYRRAGIWLPRTTGQILQYWRLDRESAPRQGDLVFFGTGHIELYAGQDRSFGAEDNRTGTWWNPWWPGNWWPTAFYRVSGAD